MKDSAERIGGLNSKSLRLAESTSSMLGRGKAGVETQSLGKNLLECDHVSGSWCEVGTGETGEEV